MLDLEREWAGRILAEYREMPGLSLTPTQGSRLWGLEPSSCQRLFDVLAASGYLRRNPQGGYVLTGHERPS